MLVQQFQNRLNFGVENELLELVRIPNIKAFTARILWKAGYKTIASIVSTRNAIVATNANIQLNEI